MSRRWSKAPLAFGAALLLAQPAFAQVATKSCAPVDLKRLAGWGGVWIAENTQTGISGRELPGAPPMFPAMKLIGLEAPWNDKGWSKFELTLRPGADGTGVESGWGFPVMMSSPSPFTIVISPAETVIVSQYREVRYIFTDGRPHAPDDERWPTIWGDSTGCWEGDTLVIDTVSVKYTPEFNYASPPLSDNAHFVERIHQTAPDRLESDITITDPETLEAPWKVHMTYLRHPVLKRLVHEGDIFDNNRLAFDKDGRPTLAPPREHAPPPPPAPPDARLTTADLDRVAGKYALDGAPLLFTFQRRDARMFVRVDPPQPFFLPVHPATALDFEMRMAGAKFHFITGANGEVTGFTGTGPDGAPIKATRQPG